MDDKFLYRNRPPVRPGFGENLYAHLAGMAPKNKTLTKQPLTFALKLMHASIVVFLLIVTFSEPVRAEVWNLIQRIAGFEIIDSAPDFNSPNAEIYSFTPQPLPSAITGLPFTFSMPAYVPENFVFSNDVAIAHSKLWVSMNWIGAGGKINLLVQQDWEITIPAGVDSTKEIKINGQPAILIQGRWDENRKWDNTTKNLQLYWRKDGIIYSLSSGAVSEDELIKMAESIE